MTGPAAGSRGAPVYLQVRSEPSERMGWITGRGDLPSLLRQYATYVERGGDNRPAPTPPTASADEAAAAPPVEPEPEEDR